MISLYTSAAAHYIRYLCGKDAAQEHLFERRFARSVGNDPRSARSRGASLGVLIFVLARRNGGFRAQDGVLFVGASAKASAVVQIPLSVYSPTIHDAHSTRQLARPLDRKHARHRAPAITLCLVRSVIDRIPDSDGIMHLHLVGQAKALHEPPHTNEHRRREFPQGRQLWVAVLLSLDVVNQLIKVNRMWRRDIQRRHDHLERAPLDGLEYFVRRVRIRKTVEFRCGRSVSGHIDRAAHPYDLSDAGKGLGIGAERERDVAHCGGQRGLA